jgi:hypothetical protein
MTRFSTLEEIIDFMLWQIDDIPHQVIKSKSTSSVYVRFVDPKLGILTIRDHKRHTKNKAVPYPKWNVIVGYRGKKALNGRRYYSEHTMLQCVDELHSQLTNAR